MEININVLYKLILLFLMTIARHIQSTQNDNFAISLQEGREGSSCLQINFKLSCNFILPNLVVMASHTQSTENNKFAKSLQYLKNAHLCWLRSVMGIISFICESKTIANDYFYLKNEGTDRGPVIMFSCLIKSFW